MKKAIIYCRASVQDDIRIVAQRQACDDYCRQHEIVVDKVFADTDAPTLPVNQPALENLLQYCRTNKGNINILLVYSPDRISTVVLDRVRTTMTLNDLGVRVDAVDGGFDLDSETGLIDAIVYTALGAREVNAAWRRKQEGISSATTE